jgi:tight adherence protein C
MSATMPTLQFASDSAADLFVLLTGVMLVCGGLALLASARRLRRQALARRVDLVRSLEADGASTASAEENPANVAGIRLALSNLPGPVRREAARWLAQLKVPQRHALAALMGLRLAFALGTTLFAALAEQRLALFQGSRMLPLLIAAGAAVGGWFTPLLILRALAKRHARAVAEGFPDALELLVVCVEAGLALEDGIDRITGELARSQPQVATELALLSADLKILPSRDRALANLAERIDLPSIHSVAATLTQSMRYGTPLAQAMRTVAGQMRNEALIELQERANRLPALMTVPMMLFIMPAIFLIVGGPAVLRLLDVLFH